MKQKADVDLKQPVRVLHRQSITSIYHVLGPLQKIRKYLMALQFKMRGRNCFTCPIKHAEGKRQVRKFFSFAGIYSYSLLIWWRNNAIKKDAPFGGSEAIHLSAMKSCHFSAFPMLTTCFARAHVWADELDPTCAAGPVLVAGCYGLL